MRTTLDIANDVLEAARELARREQRTIGEVVSDLLRRALTAPAPVSTVREPKSVYGVRPFPRRGGVVTNDLVDQLRREDAY
jgi:hypothetical protein